MRRRPGALAELQVVGAGRQAGRQKSAIWPDHHSYRVEAKQSVAMGETKCATAHGLPVRSNHDS